MNYAWDPTCLINVPKNTQLFKNNTWRQNQKVCISEAKTTNFWVMNEMKIPNFTKVMQCNEF